MLIFLFIFCLKYKPGEGKQCVVDTVDWPILLLSQFPSGVTSFTAKARKLKKKKSKQTNKKTPTFPGKFSDVTHVLESFACIYLKLKGYLGKEAEIVQGVQILLVQI